MVLATIVAVAAMAMTVAIIALGKMGKGGAEPPAPIPTGAASAPSARSGPSATASYASSATPAPTVVASAPSTASAARPAAPLKRYGGKTGYASSSDFSTCPSCDWESFRNDMGMQTAAISRCFAASEHEPPTHENPEFEFSVDASGAIGVLSDRDGSPTLDRCLETLVTAMRVPMKSSAAGSFKMGFRGECTRGWANHCD